MSRYVRVSMQHHIDVIRRLVRWNVLETEFQTTSRKIQDQRPFEIAVAISSHDHCSRPDCTKRVENGFRADIAQMPDFIRASGDFTHAFRQTIVRVREHENTPDLLGGLVEVRHI